MKINEIYKVTIYIIIISTIGIYILPSVGIRTDNIILYTSFLLIIFLLLKQKKVIIYEPKLIIYFSILVLTPIFITLIAHQIISRQFVSGSESLISSLVIIIIFSVIKFKDKFDLLLFFKNVSTIYFLILTISTILAVLTMSYNLTSINSLLWGSNKAVGFLAIGNYRYPGIFNLPIEAGIANTIGVFNLYFVRKYKFISEKFISLLVIVILIGGLLSISKVFLLFGLPLLIIGFLINKNIKHIFSGIIFIVVGYFTSSFFLADWKGFRFVENLVNNLIYGDNLLSSLTASRFGGEGSQQLTFLESILRTNPLFGTGLGSMSTYDSTITFIISSGGLMYLIIFLGVIMLALINYRKYIIPTSDSKLVLLLFIIFLIIISVGTPLLWLNKVNLYMWLFLFILIRLINYEEISDSR